MAKRTTLEHPKFARLKMKLRLSKFATLGILETLWQMVGRYTPQGNIGKYSNEEIEAWLEWDGEEGALIAALLACGWLDECPTHRLLIHDWADHIDHTTRTALKRSNLEPLVCSNSVLTKSEVVRTECAPPEPVPEPVPVPEPPAVLDAPSAKASDPEKPELRLVEVPWFESEEIPQPCRSALAEIATVPRFRKYLLAEPGKSRTAIENLWPRARDAGMSVEVFHEAAESFASYYRGKKVHTDGVATFRDWVKRDLERVAGSKPKAKASANGLEIYRDAFDDFGQMEAGQ